MIGGDRVMQKLLIDEANGMIKIGETEMKCVKDYKIESLDHFKKQITLTFIADVEMIPPNRDENDRAILPKSRT